MELKLTQAEAAGLANYCKAHNAGNEHPKSLDEFLDMLMAPMKAEWVTRVMVMPSSAFVMRFKGNEIDAAKALAAKSPEFKVNFDRLLAASTVDLTHDDVTGGIVEFCGALEQMGIIKDAKARAAEILKPYDVE